MYLWISPRHAIFPQCSSLKLNDKETWNDDDQVKLIYNDKKKRTKKNININTYVFLYNN